MRIAIIFVASLTAFPAFAQYIYDLATTRDGSVLYFSYLTSRDTKIYRWSHDRGVTLFGDRPDLTQISPHHGQHLYGTEVTDGGAVLYHAEPLCSTGMGPGFNDCAMGETQIVIPNQQPFSVGGFLLVSPNGRYGLFASFASSGLWVDWFTGEQIEVDFPYRTIPNVSPPFSVNQHAVADNGSFIVGAPGVVGLQIWSKNGSTVLPLIDYIENAAISADGSTVAVTPHDSTRTVPSSPTYVYDLASGRKTKFAQQVSLSEDGQTVAYLSADETQPPYPIAQAIVARSDGTGARQITNVPDGVHSVLLSPDARYLYVVAGNYSGGSTRIQRYEVATSVFEDIPTTPYSAAGSTGRPGIGSR